MTTTYRVRGPDGQVHEFSGPDNASPDDVLRAAQAQFSSPKAPQPSAADRARAAGQKAGADEGALMSGIRGAASGGTFGLSDYVNAAARYAGQRIAGVQNPDDFSTDVAYAKGVNEGSAEAHPVANIAGEVAGAAAPGGLIAKGLTRAAGLTKALELQKAQPVRNLLRLVGSGALGGEGYGAVQGGVQGAEQDGAPGAVLGATQGAASGAVAGAVTGPLAAGVAKGAQLAAKPFSGVSQRAIAVLADKLGETPAKIQQMLTDFRASTGRAPTIADILNAKSVANVEPVVNSHQSSAAAMLDAQQANTAALPGRMAAGVTQGGSTATPFNGASLRTARVADLRNGQNELMNDAMGDKVDPAALRNQRVVIGPQEQQLLQEPVVRSAVRDDPVLRTKLNDVDNELQVAPQSSALSVDDFDRLRLALRGQQTARLNSASPRYSPQAAGDYGQMADQLGDVATQQHPEYGAALDAYGKQERFIQSFQHAANGKSILDTPDMGDIRQFDTPEGRAGLELGARSRLAQQAGETEAGATKTANSLRQGAPSRTLESLDGKEQGALQARGAAETQSQQNYNDLAPSRVQSADKAAQDSAKNAIEGTVATVGHTLTGFKAHSIFRLLVAGNKVSEGTANEIVGLLTKPQRTPAETAALVNKINRAGLRADQRRLILKQLARSGGAAGAAALNNMTGSGP